MRNVLKTALLVATLSFGGLIGLGADTAEAGQNCSKKFTTECNRTAPKVKFNGTVQLVKPIKVTVCHTYWHRLDVGTLNGRKTKWWGPTTRYGNWKADLPASASECKTFWVKPGAVIETYATCVRRVIRTKPMTRPGYYTMS